MNYQIEEIGSRIRQLRKGRGMTQEQLAEALNISTVHMTKIENGSRGCSLDILISIAMFFDASLDYLVLGRVRENELRKQLDSTILALETLRQSL